MEKLSLKQLTLKTIALMAISSSDRGQTLHLASVKDMQIFNEKILFFIRDKLKHTRKIIKPCVITCVPSTISELNVSSYVSYYIEKTQEFRGETNQLFISWVTKKPVTKQTLARWLKTVLALAGIDTKFFKAHSYRGAGLSKAYQKGATINQIVEAGKWSNSNTFLRYYNAPCQEADIQNVILEN